MDKFAVSRSGEATMYCSSCYDLAAATSATDGPEALLLRDQFPRGRCYLYIDRQFTQKEIRIRVRKIKSLVYTYR